MKIDRKENGRKEIDRARKKEMKTDSKRDAVEIFELQVFVKCEEGEF